MKKHTAKILVCGILLIFTLFACKEADTEYIYRNTFTVSFDANGGSGKMESQTFEQEKSQNLSKNNFTSPQSGKVFAGWVKDTDSKTADYTDGQSITVGKNLTLYALWLAKEGDGTASETKGWWGKSDTFEGYGFNTYRDTRTKPGDDFYTYSLGSWLDDPNGVGVWKKTDIGKATNKDDGGAIFNQDTVCTKIKDDFLAGEATMPFNLKNFLSEAQTEQINRKETLKTHFEKIGAITTRDDFFDTFAEYFLTDALALYVSADYKRRTKEHVLTCAGINKFTYALRTMKLYSFRSDILSFEIIVKLYEEFADCTEKIEVLKDIIGEENTDAYARAFIEICKELDAFPDDVANSGNDDFGQKLLEKVNELTAQSFSGFTNYEHTFFNLLFNDTSSVFSGENSKRFFQMLFLLAAYDVYQKDSLKSMLLYRPALLKYFVDTYDSDGKNKKYVSDMCEEFRNKFIERIEKNTWMSVSSKKAAQTKAEKMLFICGYPAKIPDTSNISSTKTDFLDKYIDLYKQVFVTIINAFFDTQEEVEKITYVQMLDRDILDSNALYRPETNTVTILPSNLIDPICNTDYADAYNYSGIGAATIGHELCHAFDAEGSKRDEYGNKRNWWTVSDKLHYDDKKHEMTVLFNMFTTPESATSINGEVTLAENMADYGGLAVAYDLFVEKKIKEGFGGEKLREQKKMFFQSFAIAWSETSTDTDMVNLIKSGDEHAPPYFRVNGTVCQFDEWYDLYNVQRGDLYYLETGQRIILL